ncbi:MAG: chaperone NapD [Pseudomonadota bacterium]
MVITGSAVLVEPGSAANVVEHLKRYPQVTHHVTSDAGTELVVNLEADDFDDLERLCGRLKEEISEIVDIAHIYANFEEEVDKIRSGEVDKERLKKPKFFDNR